MIEKIVNDLRDLELDTLDLVYIAKELLNMVLNETQFNLESDKDKKEFNRISTCDILLNNILKDNKKGGVN